MNKKLLVSVLLCFFVFSLGMFAGEEKGKGKIIEHLVWADTLREIPFELNDIDPVNLTSLNSPPFLTFHVPSSKKTEVLFFKEWAQVFFMWSTSQRRSIWFQVHFRIISDSIPNDIKVYNAGTIVLIKETNFANNKDVWSTRSWRNIKYVMRRDNIGWWFVEDSGGPVPDNVALLILNDLIDNGFDVEVYSRGEIRGATSFSLYPVFRKIKFILHSKYIKIEPTGSQKP